LERGWRPQPAASLYFNAHLLDEAPISREDATDDALDAAGSSPERSAFVLEIVARSHAGRVRENNEDSIAFLSPAGIAVLADGMGGLNAGEVASREAADRVLQGLGAGQGMQQVVEEANRSIFELSQSNAELQNMGTTLVALQLVGSQMWFGNVGDSRIYRYRDKTLAQLTSDHSVVQQLVDGGLMTAAEARRAPNRNIITRALGIESFVEVDILEEQPKEHDLYMLCSDGVTDMLEPEVLEALFVAHSAPTRLVDAIVDAANSAGGFDNISVVLVAVAAEKESIE